MTARYITKGDRAVPLGELRMCDMEIIEIEREMPMTHVEFNYLPIYGFESQAPVHKGLWKTKGLCRFQLDGCHWYVGKPISRRRMKCWKASFPPGISYKGEVAQAMVDAISVHVPQMAGKLGTLVGAELVSCALHSVDADTLRAWLRYKESKE